jgi:hypothetical protein
MGKKIRRFMESCRLLHLIRKHNVMQPIQKISIPEACHQRWQQMTPVDNGRHCSNCNKIVVDFTKMTHAEIISYLGANTNACGKFVPYQLNAINNHLEEKNKRRFSWKGLALAATLASLFATIKAEAKDKILMEQAPADIKHKAILSAADSIPYITINGKIIANDDKLPIVGASVFIKGKSTGTVTNQLGEFRLKVPSDAVGLKISFIGYKSCEANVSNFVNGTNTVVLQMEPAIMGDITIVKRPTLVKRCWNKVKRIF